ncbi:DUF302 domain-containing protein [Hydrogenovibrio kuenenii]|uniref:DUF302 domain-containing protein n=1 Tax=Hydrogenovibrio kuenenii TaxID=63658 RepID=UPI00046658D2|nr:DUF302 domain-containing protein [Hydrogenovibrio kuenenii]
MKYVVTSDKSVDEVCSAMEKAVPEHKFGIVGEHDLKATMAKKGVEFHNEVRVFEICNPMKAKSVLSVDMDLASALPCRISVYSDNGVTKISMIKPTDMLKALNDDPSLLAVAEEVEAISISIINAVK